ncbi:hypothetical protein FF1_039773 [Malus domestica]
MNVKLRLCQFQVKIISTCTFFFLSTCSLVRAQSQRTWLVSQKAAFLGFKTFRRVTMASTLWISEVLSLILQWPRFYYVCSSSVVHIWSLTVVVQILSLLLSMLSLCSTLSVSMGRY